MTRIRQKMQGITKQSIGKMIGDDELVVEGKEEQRQAEKNEPDEARQGNGKRGERE